MDLHISPNECAAIEAETRLQAKCKTWHIYRSGRITASKFKRCCRTNIDKPSLSLIDICYPVMYQYKVRALDYGCNHEKYAIRDFTIAMKKKHQGFEVKKVGLVVNPKWPYFGASPDGMCNCECCESALLEVKCPYCVRDSVVSDLTFKNSFLKTIGDQLLLKTDHAYYYQIQMQLALTERNCCYLVVWTKQNFETIKVHFDEPFWLQKRAEAENFFQQVLLPELMGKLYTRSKDEVAEEKPEEDNLPGPSKPTLYCLCQKEDDHKTPMISCDNNSCSILWYHLDLDLPVWV